jgi:type III restriction enzyme
MNTNNPILNNPYEEPRYHYATNEDGELDYDRTIEGRRIFTPDIKVIPTKQGEQKTIFSVNDLEKEYGSQLINLIRKEVGQWRASCYPQITRVSKELLTFWFNNPERHDTKRMFFAQREAVETAIWLNEVAEKSNAGNHILERLKNYQTVNGQPENNLPRIAFKMATGTGKTVVMAALILYHFFNRQEYRGDTRFADYFLVVTPGITIKDRLGVLYVDTLNRTPQSIQDYYRVRGLVPQNFERGLFNLNAKIVITNYHVFEPRALSGNKRNPFDGKLNAEGEKMTGKEDYNLVIKRLLGKFKTGSRLLILNDEAHHCYLPLEKGKSAEGEDTVEENARAAVWYNGLVEISRRFKVKNLYDLSATPYFLSGSGYDAYSLFPWTVIDFGLIESIESGLVKIPFLPESDNTQELEMPVLRNLYEHVKDELPKKGQRRAKSEAKKEGKSVREEPPRLPAKVKTALDQFYNHYKDTYEFKGKAQLSFEDIPPVFIVVCNNTSVSREMYKFIAGYEIIDDNGEIVDTVTGYYDFFSNYDKVTKKPLHRPPTLLIDSDALENSNQINDEFKKIFGPEIDEFKKEYRIKHPDRSPENITDADILREVVNTVGKPGTLGSHVRCVVSVSMLTEGWDANTVTHIMGLRAFGSQLLCEQVAGRALRRRNYYLETYDKEGNPTADGRKIVTSKFPPEYAHIIGVPFKMFKGGKTPPQPPVDHTRIFAIPERQRDQEITFPNLIGYRIESLEGDIKADFSKIENFEIDGTQYPVETEMGSAFTPELQKMKVKSILEMRDQEIVYYITKELIKYYYSDDEGNPFFQKFNKLKKVVSEWYENKVVLPGITDVNYKRLLFFFDPKVICEHVMRGIYDQQKSTDNILPVFNFYNRFGSTTYVNGNTSREVYPTVKSHVNYVVADTESWEQIAAKTLEELDEVICYVKNAFLGFVIPYVDGEKDWEYYPDFIARCKTDSGKTVNLIIEITGMNKDKAVKKWHVENRWLPAVNAVRDKFDYDEWYFIEIANDIRYIKNQLVDMIKSL